MYSRFLQQGGEYSLSAVPEPKKTADVTTPTSPQRTLIDLGLGDPSDPTFEGARNAAIDYLQAHTSTHYPRAHGDQALRQAIAQWANRNYNCHIDAEQHVLSSNGSKEAVWHFPLLFQWTDDACIAYPALSYPVYASSAGLLNIPTLPLAVDERSEFLPDLTRISDAQWQKIRLFWLNSPHNPSSSIANRRYLETLLEKAKKFDFFVGADEAYNDIFYDQKPLSCLDFADSDRWIVFRSLSKRSHMTGYRSGAVISKNTEIIKLMRKMRAPIGLGTPSFIQAAAIAAWDDDAHPIAHATAYRSKRDRIVAALEAKGFIVFGARATFFLWFRHRDESDDLRLKDCFSACDVRVTAGRAFGDDGKGYIRLAYAISDNIVDTLCQRIQQLEITVR